MIALCRWVAVVLLTSLLVACSTQYFYTPINPDPMPQPPRPASAVEVFTSSAPTRPHVDVQVIDVYATSDETTAFRELRAEAGRRGCDGLYVPKMNGGHVKGTCMRYTTR